MTVIYRPLDEFMGLELDLVFKIVRGSLKVIDSGSNPIVLETLDQKFATILYNLDLFNHGLLDSFFGAGREYQVRLEESSESSESSVPSVSCNEVAQMKALEKAFGKCKTNTTVGFWPYMTRARASVTIQKWFKGWSARKRYRYNPHTTLGKHLFMAEFKKLLTELPTRQVAF